MDCKRPHRYRALKWLLSIGCFLAMASCTWVKDDTETCMYGFWLKLRYTYNIMDVDASEKYINDAYVYIYDAEGNYVRRIVATQDMLRDNNYRVKVEGLSEGDYQFVVWSGIGISPYAVSEDTQAIDGFRLSLSGAGTTIATELPPLYHGYLSTVHYDDSYAQYDVELMKNTNQMSCLIMSIDPQAEIIPDDYTLKLVAANGTMDAHNRLTTTTETTYEPFDCGSVTINDQDYGELHGIRFNITTLRLMSNDNSRIILQRKSTGETVFNISFPEYIGMIGALYTNLGRPLSEQEYLDRQDFYTIVFFLSGDLNQLIQLKVNTWRLRAYNHLKI